MFIKDFQQNIVILLMLVISGNMSLKNQVHQTQNKSHTVNLFSMVAKPLVKTTMQQQRQIFLQMVFCHKVTVINKLATQPCIHNYLMPNNACSTFPSFLNQLNRPCFSCCSTTPCWSSLMWYTVSFAENKQWIDKEHEKPPQTQRAFKQTIYPTKGIKYTTTDIKPSIHTLRKNILVLTKFFILNINICKKRSSAKTKTLLWNKYPTGKDGQWEARICH